MERCSWNTKTSKFMGSKKLKSLVHIEGRKKLCKTNNCRFSTFSRLFVKNRCLGCGDKIGSDELVMRALDNVFHLKCFICVVCGVRLQKGDQYVIKQSQLFCRPDYEKEVEMFQYNYGMHFSTLLQRQILMFSYVFRWILLWRYLPLPNWWSTWSETSSNNTHNATASCF